MENKSINLNKYFYILIGNCKLFLHFNSHTESDLALLRNDKRNLSTEEKKKKKKTYNHQMIFLFI